MLPRLVSRYGVSAQAARMGRCQTSSRAFCAAAVEGQTTLSDDQKKKVDELAMRVMLLKMKEWPSFVRNLNAKKPEPKIPFRHVVPEVHYRAAVDGGMVGGGGGGAAEAVVEEQTEFDVVLKSFDAKSKIKVIKEVRALTGLGLKEAKELVEGAPKALKKGVTKEEGKEIMDALKAIGGEVELE